MRSKHLAGFLIYLMISLVIIIPIQVSAFSATITGKANIPNIREQTDITKITAFADSPVSLKSLNGQEYQMDCKEGTPYICDYTFSENTLSPGTHEITLTQKEGDPKSITEKFTVDGDPPEIKIIKEQLIQTQTGEKINLSLEINDPTYDSQTDCSGIRTITISTNSNELYNQNIDEHKCTYQLNKLLNLPNIEGKINLLITAKDFLSQSKTISIENVSINNEAPRITNEITFLLNNREITKIAEKPQEIPLVKLKLIIEEQNLSEVYIDASKITKNPNVFPTYTHLLMNCEKQESSYACTTEGLELNPSSNKINFTITAIDSKGNKAVKIVTKKITLVKNTGEVTYLDPPKENCDGTMCYVKPGLNKLELQIKDNNSILPSLIRLNTGIINDNAEVSPYKCNETSQDIFLCEANILVTKNMSGLKSTIQLVNPSTDLTGNRLTGKTKTKVMLDADKPELIKEPKFSNYCPTASMSTKINLTVKDKTSSKLYITVDANKTTTQGIFKEECKNESNKEFLCQVSLNHFVNYPESENISIIITDLAGNELVITKPFEVCQAESQVVPETIKQITTETSQKINKRLASVVSTKLFLPLTFHFQPAIASKTKIISLDTDGCVKTKYLAGDPYFLNKEDFIANQKTSNDRGEAILVVPIGKQPIGEDEVNINCTIKIYETIKNTRYTKPEEQEINLAIPTYNNPLGTVDQATTEQLKTIKEEINGIQKDIDKRMKLNQVFKTLCIISDTLGKVSEGLAIVQSAAYVIALAMQAIPQLQLAGQRMWSRVCKGITKGFFPAKKKLFKDNLFNNAQSTLTQFLKAGCTIYHCGFCTVNGAMTVASLTMNAGKSLGIGSGKSSTTSKSSQQTTSETKQSSTKVDSKKAVVATSPKSSTKLTSSDKSVSTNKGSNFDITGHVNPRDSLYSLEKVENDIIQVHNLREILITSSGSSAELSKKTVSLAVDNPQLELKGLNGINQKSTDQTDLFSKQFQPDQPTDWIINPYKSKGFARTCLCNSGMIYALNKEKQLKCREYSCIKKSSEEGLPIYNCQKNYAVGSCLYVDGAISKKTLLKKLWEGIKNSLLSDPIRTVRMAVCIDDYLPLKTHKSSLSCDFVINGFRPTFCSLTDAYIHLQTLTDLKNNVFKSSEDLLEPGGEDYCQEIRDDLQ